VDARDREIAELKDQVRDLILVVERQAARITELEARLNSDSSTSSKPPSSDGLTKRRSVPRQRGVRPPGKQPGTDGRFLSQVTAPDVVVEHEPHSCGSCGSSLIGAPLMQTETRQVADLPPIELVWTEHRSRRRRCSCGHVTAGVFPEDVTAPAQYGPNLKSAAAYLCSYQHVPFARAAEAFRDLLGADVSVGWLYEHTARVAIATLPSVELIADAIADSAVAHFDETGARVDGVTRWVHVASTESLTHLALNDRRGQAAMHEHGILPRFTGLAVHDGLHAYRVFEQATHVLCNAHHLRELAGMVEHFDQPWAQDMIDLLLEIKDHADHARATGNEPVGSADQRRFRHYYDEIIADGHFANPPPPKTGQRGRPKLAPAGRLVHRLDRDRNQVLRFMTDPRVPFDNNQAERDVRNIKVRQKVSGCWRTVPGAERYMALRSYIDTCRKNQINIMTALRAAIDGCPWQPTPA